ncbi:hypothetical protein [uncultured Mediterranean phage uvMED]|nr:hypothetical protein [uncultured Mediterranean phage uvMED]
MSDQKLLRLEKRHKGLARVTAAINDLYIYGVYESNYPALMDILNEAKDACKDELRDTHVEIVALTKANELTKLTPSTEEQLQEVFEE